MAGLPNPNLLRCRVAAKPGLKQRRIAQLSAQVNLLAIEFHILLGQHIHIFCL